jgi:hypothetical protein
VFILLKLIIKFLKGRVLSMFVITDLSYAYDIFLLHIYILYFEGKMLQLGKGAYACHIVMTYSKE